MLWSGDSILPCALNAMRNAQGGSSHFDMRNHYVNFSLRERDPEMYRIRANICISLQN